MLNTAAMSFVDIKSALVDATGLSRDALHIHLGLIILCAGRLIWHGRTGWLAAWFGTMCFTVVGEFFDRQAGAAGGNLPPWSAHWHDVWNTLIWPSVVALIGWRLTPVAPSGQELSGQDADQSLEQA